MAARREGPAAGEDDGDRLEHEGVLGAPDLDGVLAVPKSLNGSERVAALEQQLRTCGFNSRQRQRTSQTSWWGE